MHPPKDPKELRTQIADLRHKAGLLLHRDSRLSQNISDGATFSLRESVDREQGIVTKLVKENLVASAESAVRPAKKGQVRRGRCRRRRRLRQPRRQDLRGMLV